MSVCTHCQSPRFIEHWKSNQWNGRANARVARIGVQFRYLDKVIWCFARIEWCQQRIDWLCRGTLTRTGRRSEGEREKQRKKTRKEFFSFLFFSSFRFLLSLWTFRTHTAAPRIQYCNQWNLYECDVCCCFALIVALLLFPCCAIRDWRKQMHHIQPNEKCLAAEWRLGDTNTLFLFLSGDFRAFR